MKRFVQGEDRTQGTLLPDLLGDYVAADNPVRVIEIFVDELDLGKLGFQGVDPQATTGTMGLHHRPKNLTHRLVDQQVSNALRS